MPRVRRTDPDAVRLPPDLVGPVDVELTRAVEEIPGPNALPGGSRYEPKFDGFRCTIVRRGDEARLWSRQRKDLTDRFPDIAAAAVRQIDDGVVLDGELLMLVDGRLSFDALQRRLVTSPAKVRQLVAAVPASYVAFDLLAVAGVDLRTQRWTVRRGRLEQLATGFSPPLQLTPVTADLAEAREWFDVLPAAMGVEGLVVKGAATRYVGGRREWLKVKHRATREFLIGGVLGPITRPEVVIAGLYRGDDLVIVGRTVPLSPAQSAELGAVLTPAKPGHPWPDEITSQRWGGKDSKKPLTKVESLDLEVAANMSLEWSPIEIRDFLYRRAMDQKVSLRERGTAAHVMWSRALDSTASDSAQAEAKKLLRDDIIDGFKRSPREDVAVGEGWLATTLEVVMDKGVQVCDEFPDINQDWQRSALRNLAAIKESALPEHLKSATYQLAQHAIFQNSGVERRRAVDTLQAAGLLDPVTRAFANIISESDQAWLRIRAIFALGFMQDPSQRVQQALIDACQRTYETVLDKGDAVPPSAAAELHASLFAVGDCFGAPGYHEEAKHVRGELEDILTDLVTETTAAPELHLVARATGYLLTVTAQPTDGSKPDLSKDLLEALREHKDPVTQRLSDWALTFRFPEGGEVNPMCLAPLAAAGKSRT